MNQEELKYPIGKFKAPVEVSKSDYDAYINQLRHFPADLRNAVENLSEAQLNTPYREGGWTIRQVVHHCADSHMNAFIRLKLALTESEPVIKPYREELWSELPDSRMPVQVSLQLIESLHQRWVFLLENLNEGDLQRTFIHPEHGRSFRLDISTANYAWHARHHLAHITSLSERKGWGK